MAKIAIYLHHPHWKTLLKPYGKTVREACGAVFGIRDSGFGIRETKGEMTVVLADDDFIRELNRAYRGKNKPTNVLAFPSLATNHQPLATHLGDLVLALETIEHEAKEQEKSFKDHVRHLLVHGTLHLLGYDHERRKDAARMEALEIKILENLGVANPYL